MEIRKISTNEFEHYCRENNHVFSSLDWLSVVRSDNQTLHHYKIELEGKVLAVFSLIYRSGRFLKCIELPYLTPHQTLIPVDAKIDSNLYKFFLKFLESQKSDSIYLAINPYHSSYLKSLNLSGFTNIERRTYQIELARSEDELFSSLKTDKKRNIKAAIKEQLTVSLESQPQILSGLIEKTYERQSKSIEWLPIVNRIAESKIKSFQVTVSSNDRPLSSLLIVYDSHTAYYLCGGFDDSQSNYNAGPFAMWNAILETKRRGLKVFDFEGSEIPEIEKYFQRFGSKKVTFTALERRSLKQKLIHLIK